MEQITADFQVIPWWETHRKEEAEADCDDVLMTADETLQKIVTGALQLMHGDSTVKVERRIKRFVNRKRLIGNRRNHRSEDTHVDCQPMKQNEPVTPITQTNVGYQLLEKIGWTPGVGLGLNQDGIKAPIQINLRNRRQGLGYEKK